jgi:hypothetical protein
MEKQIIFKFPSIFGLLGVAFIVLKLVGVISWSWWWVTLPFWGPIILLFIILIIILTIIGFIVCLNIK